VDPGAGPGQQLALALRELREDSGNPTYRAMAERAHYSASALARAASGTAFPSRDLVLAYVRSCGGDQAEWDQRWAAAAAQAGHDGEPEHAHRPGPPGQEPHGGTPRRRRPRRLAIAVAAAAAVPTLTAGILLVPGPRHPAPHPPATLPSTSAAAGSSQPADLVPVRRQGLLVLAPGQVADLDTPASRAPGWGIVNEPGSAADDIWFSSTDHALHGNQNANIAVLPAGSAATHSACALEQDYGVTLDAPRIRPGQLVCDITSDNRVALLRITGVRHAANGTPDQVTFTVTVWVPPHKT
jgi:hypothetical protein